MNCSVWALADLVGVPPSDVLDLLRPYAARGWVEYDDDGQVDSVTMPEVAVALLPTLGFDVASYKGTGPAVAAGWARWSARWYRGDPLLLVVDSAVPSALPKSYVHVLIARDGLLFDNNVPDGLPGAEHPYAAAKVRVVLRLYDGGTAEVQNAGARRWPVVAVG